MSCSCRLQDFLVLGGDWVIDGLLSRRLCMLTGASTRFYWTGPEVGAASASADDPAPWISRHPLHPFMMIP